MSTRRANIPPVPFISDDVYNILKGTVQIVLPAVGTLYFGLAALWGFPYAEQVVGTCAVLALFLGTVIGVNKSRYENSDEKYDGTMTDDGVSNLPTLEFNEPLANLATKKEIKLKVDNISH